jgi:hypothetical protein
MATIFHGGPGTVPAQRAGPTVARQAAPAMLQTMQRSAGNAAVASYVQRLAESPGPVRPTGAIPGTDPRFLAVTAKVAAQGKALRQHPSPRTEVEKAKNAAIPPAGDKEAQAKEAQAATMAGAKPAGFDKAGFIAAVKAAIAAQAPKSLEEAEEFAGSGKAETVKNQVAGKVTDGKAASAKDIAEKTAAAPDQSKAVDKPVTPLAPEPQPASAPVDAAAGMPGPAPAEQTDLSGGKRDTDAAMAEADVSEQQLAGSNEPEFVGAVAAKKAGEEHSASAPAAFRAAEAAHLGSARQSAQGAGAAGLGGMLSAKKGALVKAAAAKGSAKANDETERAKVAGEVKAIFDATKKDVDAILGSLDGAVNQQFSEGERFVREAFTADVKKRVADYKKRRYSGWDGDLLWAKDKIFNLPKEADQEYVVARVKYENEMAALIGRVADTIGAKLIEAKDRIAKGRADIKAYVDSKPRNLQKVAQEAASQFADQFDQLESAVDAKKDALVEDLAAKYTESRTAVDAEITAMQDENKGLWDKAKEAVGGAIQTVLQLKDMLLTVFTRAANAVGKIIKDPIGFLGNFVNAVKGGIVQFGQNIVEHLKKGLQGWLLGALAEGGIELPEKFDVKGIVQLLMSIFGMTWAHIRTRIVAKIGEPVMGKLEKGFEIVRVLVTEGIGGLWKWVVEKVGDIKEMLMSQIKEMVSVEIIKAGIVWLISLLNPASAFVKACKMIYDVVMFFVEKAEQIKAFVDSVLDSVESIAAGGVGAVAGHIEKTLAKMLPVLIGFLASLLGLGGISGKIKKILETLQKPINAVVDWVVTKAIKYGKKFLGFAKKVGGKLKAKGKEMLGKAKKKLGIKEKTPETSASDGSVRSRAGTELRRRLGQPVSASQTKSILDGVYSKFSSQGLKSVVLKRSSGRAGVFDVMVECSPSAVAAQALAAMSINARDLNFREGTTCVVSINGKHVATRRASADESLPADQHAEAKCLSILEGRWPKLVTSASSAADIELNVTRSPCAYCTTRIIAFKGVKEAAHPNLRMTIRAASLYEGEASRVAGTSKEDLRELRDEHKVQIETWDILKVMSQRMGRPVSLADLPAETVRKLDQKARQLTEELANLEHVRVGR